MRVKLYKVCSFTVNEGIRTPLELDLEMEGGRAFVVWDRTVLGRFALKARLEVDPRRLKKTRSRRYDYIYRGRLVLPRPQDN